MTDRIPVPYSDGGNIRMTKGQYFAVRHMALHQVGPMTITHTKTNLLEGHLHDKMARALVDRGWAIRLKKPALHTEYQIVLTEDGWLMGLGRRGDVVVG